MASLKLLPHKDFFGRCGSRLYAWAIKKVGNPSEEPPRPGGLSFLPLLPQKLIVYAKAMQVRGTSTRNQAGIVKDQVPGADS